MASLICNYPTVRRLSYLNKSILVTIGMINCV